MSGAEIAAIGQEPSPGRFKSNWELNTKLDFELNWELCELGFILMIRIVTFNVFQMMRLVTRNILSCFSSWQSAHQGMCNPRSGACNWIKENTNNVAGCIKTPNVKTSLWNFNFLPVKSIKVGDSFKSVSRAHLLTCKLVSTASGALGVGGVRDICSSIDGVTSRR